MRDFTNEEDIRESQEMSKEKGRTIRINDGEKVPVYLMSSAYHDGFAHWVTLPNGNVHRVACGGGEKGEGNDPDSCPICAYCAEQFQEAKQLRSSGRKVESEALWQQTRKMAGSYEIYFVAAQGSINVVKIEDGKKKMAVEFDSPRIALLRLTRKQRDDLKATVNESEHLTSLKDLFNRWLIIDKRVRGKDDYASLDFIPAPKPTPKPKVEIDEDALEINKLFKIDKEELKTVLNLLINGGDEEVELEEGQEDEEATVEESGETGEEGVEEEGEPEQEEEASVDVAEEPSDVATDDEESSKVGMDFLDDVDDDFEDDLPWEEKSEAAEEEPALPKAKAGAKTSPAKAAPSQKVQSKSSAKRMAIQKQSVTGQKPKGTSSSPAKTSKPITKKPLGSKASSPKASSSKKPPKRTDL